MKVRVQPKFVSVHRKTCWTSNVTTGLPTRSTDNLDLFTPKNVNEVDFIWTKYPIENSIWTDFVRANTSAFYRDSFILFIYLWNISYGLYLIFDMDYIIWIKWNDSYRMNQIKSTIHSVENLKVRRGRSFWLNSDLQFLRVTIKRFGVTLEWPNLELSKMEFSEDGYFFMISGFRATTQGEPRGSLYHKKSI